MSYCRETHPVEASCAVGLSLRLLLRSLLRLRSRRERSLLERSLDLLRLRSRRRRPILAPLCYAAPRARVQHSHSRAVLKASCSVRRCLFRRADQLVGFEMTNSDARFVALSCYARARPQSDAAARPVLASVFQDASSYGFSPDSYASSAWRRSPHGSPEAWKGWLAARRQTSRQANRLRAAHGPRTHLYASPGR